MERKHQKPNLAYSRSTVAKATIDALLDYSESKNAKIDRKQIIEFSKYLSKRKKHLQNEY